MFLGPWQKRLFLGLGVCDSGFKLRGWGLVGLLPASVTFV